MADTPQPRSVTGQPPGSASRAVARPQAPAEPEADPHGAEVESLRRLLLEKDQELAQLKVDAEKYADVKAIEERMQKQIDAIRDANLTAEGQVKATRTLDAAKAEGYGALLQQAGFTARAIKPTAGVRNPLPEGHIYRLTASARYPTDHPLAGQLCYRGVTCVIIPPDSDQQPITDEARQHCVRFEQGVGLTDDREAAWQMARDYGYSLEVETRPVVQIKRPDATYEQILKDGKLVGAGAPR